MAKNNNLKDFVTGIASAIREKKGTTELINPQDFENEIRTIQTGSDPAGGKSLAAQIIDRSVTDVTAGDLEGATKIGDYAFYACSGLTSITIPDSVTAIGGWAFDNCINLGTITLPKSITNVGQWAFKGVGSSKNTPFVFEVDSACTVGGHAFESAKVSKVKGKLTSIGSYGFSSCSALAEIDISQSGDVGSYAFQNDQAITTISIKIVGSVGDYAFYDCRAVASHALDVGSVISSLGSYAFSRYGSKRANPEQNIQVFDLRSSTFTKINQRAFGSDSSSNNNRYQRIYFPSTVTSVQQYAFRCCDNCDFYFDSETPPTMVDTTAWSNATNCGIFVPYGKVNAYRTATNWTAQAANIKGYAKPNTFTLGDTLPELNVEGYELTWYSDKACTTEVTTVADASAEYYCIAGETKVAYGITSVVATDCTITITDGVKIYHEGDGVRVGTVLTITGTPTTEGYTPYMFKVNGADFTSGDTLTVAGDVSVMAIYWNGEDVPVNPTFSQNTWAVIRSVARAGTASQFWNVGDTKDITLTNGATITFRIADLQTGRYALADNSGSSNMVLEPLVQIPNTTAAMNSSGSNSGGFAQSQMRTVTLANIYDLFPQDVKDAMSEVLILSGTGAGTSSGTSSSANKLFLPAEMELFASKSYSIGDAECPLGQFDYYKMHNNDSDRIKQRDGSNQWYWLRSPYSGYSDYFCSVTSYGLANMSAANFTNGVAPCFAI